MTEEKFVTTDKQRLKLMDQAVHALAQQNPIAHELKKATHRKGAINHDMTLATAFTAMHHLLGFYAELYTKAGLEAKEQEKPSE